MVYYLIESNPQIGLAHKNLREEVPRSRICNVALVTNLILYDLLLHSHRVTLVIEGKTPTQQVKAFANLPCQKFDHHDSKTPHIGWEGVARLCAHNFWSSVSHRTTVRVSALCSQFFRKAKVNELHVALAIDHHVVGLDVTENNFLLVQVFQSQQDFRTVESDPSFPPA